MRYMLTDGQSASTRRGSLERANGNALSFERAVAYRGGQSEALHQRKPPDEIADRI
jgi:hypothetical protein